MRTRYATLLLVFGMSLGASAQVSSDDPTVQNQSNSKIPQLPTAPIMPESMVTGTVFPCGGGTDTLINQGSCGAVWASDSAGTNILSTSDTLIAGPLTSDSTFYLIGLVGNMNASAPLPPHNSNYSGNVRGYYFTSPVDMIITGLWIPTEGSTAPQNVEVLIFDNQTPPPLFSSTTNAFVSQGNWQNYPAGDTINTCIQVSAGDVVGIYGQRDLENSYGSGFTSSIDGNAVTFTRTGMQQPLQGGQMANVFSEASGSISRVEFFYDVNPVVGSATPVNVTVPYPTSSSSNATICDGDSLFVGGAYQTTAGIYNDTLTSFNGCDSIHTTTLSTDFSYSVQASANICIGDSILLGGAYQTTAGFYTDSLQTVLGCDSTIVTFLDVTAYPTVTFTNPGDTICAQASSFSMNGAPTGGVYTGSGASGDMFDPSSANIGANDIVYVYTDSVGCAASDSAVFYVQDCASIGEATLQGVSVYPNPASSVVTVALPDYVSEGTALFYDAKGRLVQSNTLTETVSSLEISTLSAGVYVIEINNTIGQSAQFRLIKK